jgi:geranylgeranyl reductase family protein
MSTSYDAVVVGAGPAGASAAHVLARGGARVLLVERAALPRYKPCGGGLTPRARAASPLVERCTLDTTAVALTLRGMQRQVSCDLPLPIGMTMRDRFDAYLAEQAAAAGAVVHDRSPLSHLEQVGSTVRLQAGSDWVTARYLIGADGANGVTARLAGFGPAADPATAIEAEIAVPEAVRARYERRTLLDFQTVPGGYAWIFGKRDHLSIGVYTLAAASRKDLRPALARFILDHPDLRVARVLLQRGHRVPLTGGRRTRRRGRVVLAGDAAALADPLTGEGISYALASGRRAGSAVLAALGGDAAALETYDAYLQRDLTGDLRYARLVAWAAYRFPEFGLRLAANHAQMRTLAAAAISGTLAYRTLARHLLQGAPKLVPYAVARLRGI